MANREKIEAVLQHIEAHPDELNMNTWINVGKCGTVACFAGHAALLNGGVPVPGSVVHVSTPEQDVVFTEVYAAKVLDLTRQQAIRIFYCDAENPAGLRRRVEEVLADE